MGKLVVRRKVVLDFLGDGYKDAYVIFRAIPVKDYAELLAQIPSDPAEDKGKSMGLMIECLKKYFLEGQVKEGDKLTADDLDDIDQDTTIRCFQAMSGQNPDPKSEAPLKEPSSIEQNPQ